MESSQQGSGEGGEAVSINLILQTEWDRPTHENKRQNWAFDSSRLTLDHSCYPLCWPVFERCPLILPAAQRAARWPGSMHTALAAMAGHYFLTRVIAFKTKLRYLHSVSRKNRGYGWKPTFGWVSCVNNLDSLVNLNLERNLQMN